MSDEEQVHFKDGANTTDINRIRKYAKAGNSAEAIAAELRIKTKVVEGFMEKPKKKKPAAAPSTPAPE